MNNSKMVLTVSQVNEYIRAVISNDDVLSMIVVRGEISNLTIHRSGHIYFTLKDEDSVLKSVMFRSSASRVRFALKEGMNVIVYGRISVYAPTGQYQLYAEDIQPDGIGALYIAYEQIKERLTKEGLFDQSRKKSIPKIPQTVGIITSPTGAAIHDMINVMGRRFPLTKLLLYPALVQGDGAAQTLINGLAYFNQTDSCDVIIIGRGGGSMEDLWAFNDINLAYAIADSHIPVISAVGHESDFTICDFVADLRAPTPSAAAELAVPDALTVRAELLHKLTLTQNHLASKLTQERRRLEVLSNSRVLQSREALLDEYKMKINLLYDKLDANIERILSLKDKSFSVMAAQLNAISPLNTLSRGYAIVQNDNGDALSSICNLNTNDKISLLFADGKANATVTSIEHPKGD